MYIHIHVHMHVHTYTHTRACARVRVRARACVRHTAHIPTSLFYTWNIRMYKYHTHARNHMYAYIYMDIDKMHSYITHTKRESTSRDAFDIPLPMVTAVFGLPGAAGPRPPSPSAPKHAQSRFPIPVSLLRRPLFGLNSNGVLQHLAGQAARAEGTARPVARCANGLVSHPAA